VSFPGVDMPQRRRDDRRTLRAHALIAVDGGQVAEARTRDLGAGGASVVCDLNLRVGQCLTLRIMLPGTAPGHTPFEAHATVTDCTLAGREGGFRIDLRFDALGEAAQAALRGLSH
jgi:hypothetical protein